MNERPTTSPVTVHLADDRTIHSTHEGHLPFDNLPPDALRCHKFPALGGTSLLSVGQLCDHGCEAHFTHDTVTITRDDVTVLTGKRNAASNKLWTLDVQPQHVAHAAHVNRATKEDLVAFSHAAVWSPTLSCFKTAFNKGFLHGFPGLSAEAITKYPPRSVATQKGHLDKLRQGIASTQPDQPATLESTIRDCLEDAFPPSEDGNELTHLCYATIFEPRGQVHSDLTGRFPIPSTTGQQYILIVYDYDSNSILFATTASRKASALRTAMEMITARLIKGGCRPKFHRLDNECSTEMQKFLSDSKQDYQLVPPHDHRRNAAERAIRTAKNHLIAGWCSADHDFPLQAWADTIEAAEISLNLLRASRINPSLSAYEQLHGRFDYNRTPLAPPGVRVTAFVHPEQRASWDPHALDGWYVGPAMNSYRCHTIYIKETGKTRICETVKWFPDKIRMPIASPDDLLRASLNDLAAVLKSTTGEQFVGHLDRSTYSQLVELAELLTNSNETARAAVPTVPILESDLDRLEASSAPPVEATKQVTFDPSCASPGPSTLHADVYHPDPAPSPRVPIVEPATSPPASPRVTAPVATPTPATPPRPRRAAPRPVSPSPPRRSPRTSKHIKGVTLHRRAHVNALYAAQYLHQRMCHLFSEEFAYKALNPDTKVLSEFPVLAQSSDGEHWISQFCHELGRLFQGYTDKVKTTAGTNTAHFIMYHDIPQDRRRDVTYVRVVCTDRPQKAPGEQRRVRITAGGDRVNYPGEVSTKTSDIITAKLLFNSTLSTPGARFMCIDLKDFYLNHILPRSEYARIPLSIIPAAFIEAYDLHKYAHNGHVYFAIGKGMYGLPQAGRVAYDALMPQLAAAGYHPTGHTHGLFHHESNSIKFALTVDDFGVLYTDKADAEHLIAALSPHYKLSIDWDAKIYCGIHLRWDYEARTVDLSMPGYVAKVLQRFTHPKPARPQHAPHKWTVPAYGAKQQLADPDDDSPKLSKEGIKRVQEVVGCLLFYCRAVDLSLHVALGSISAQQAEPTELTMDAVVHLLNYCATHPDAVLRYRASKMILCVHSDASYLSEAHARSRVGGFFFLDDEEASTSDAGKPNGAIHVESKILRNVMSSAAEAEAAGLFHNCQAACGIRTTLEEMGWPQPPTIIMCDNTKAAGIANDTVKPRRTKAMDMRFWWVRDRVRQGQFKIQWAPGISNHADYFTKHFPPSHHQEVRPTYFLYLANHMALLDCEGVLISIPSQLVTDAFFQSSNAAREPDSLCVDLLTFLHDEIPNF